MSTTTEMIRDAASTLRGNGEPTDSAVADWMDDVAEWQEFIETQGREHAGVAWAATQNHALAVAIRVGEAGKR